MDPRQNDLEALRALVRDLAERVERLERAIPATPGVGKLATTPLESKATPAAPPEQIQGARSPVTLPPAQTTPPSPSAAHPEARPMPPVPPRPAPAGSTAAPQDLESRIGSHWLNRIGIAAVLIGVSYFLKYAFDNNWIGPGGRVAIGLLAGVAIVVWSERFRARGYRMFSYSLKAVGIGAMYLSLWAAFQVYSLIPSGVAFVAMLTVTAATAVLALTQDAEILAAFALTGGFTTPFLLSTGQNRELQLFSYVALLDLAALALVARKPWRRLLLLSYLGTLILYVGWYSEFYSRSQLNPTASFATLFFAIFAVAPLVARRPEGEATFFSTLPMFLALVNAGVFFLQLYAMVEEVSKTAMAWVALALAAVYIVLSRLARQLEPDPEGARRIHFLHLALAIGFITVAIPIRLDGHWITMGWFVEAAVLLWVADRIHSEFLNAFAICALVLGIVRLLAIDNFYTTTLLFNSRVATYTVAIAVLAGVAWFGRQRADERGRQAAAIAVVALNVLALIALSREVSDYFSRQMVATRSGYPAYNPGDWVRWRALRITEGFTYSALWMSYGALLMIIGFWRRSAFVRWQALVLIAVTIVKVFVYDVSQLDRGYRIVSFIVLGALLLAISFVYQRDWLQLSRQPARKEAPTA